MRLTYLPLTALLLLLLTVLGRGMGYIYSTMATDIAYSDLVVEIFGILVEILTILRTVFGYCAILYAMYRWERQDTRYRCGWSVMLTVLVCDAVDCLSRYLVDKATSSITDLETMAMLWLTLQFCYSTILVLICWSAGLFLFHPAAGKEPAGQEKAVTLAVLWLLGTRLALEVYYVIDFFVTYTNPTGTELASMLGQFLYTFILYGCAAWGMGMGISLWLKNLYGRKPSAVPAVFPEKPEEMTQNAGF